MKCPRCLSESAYVCREGKENDRLVWTLFYCRTCEFNWRDSEPGETVDPGLRPSAFQMDPTRPEEYPVVIPPLKPRL